VLNARSGFGFCVGILQNFFASRDDLLKCGDLHCVPAAYRTTRFIRGNDQVSPLLSELDERELVIYQLVHLQSRAVCRHKIEKLCFFGFRDTEHFRELLRRGAGPRRRSAGVAPPTFSCTRRLGRASGSVSQQRACYRMVSDHLTKSGAREVFPGQQARRSES
jgi:hypothetical protein